MRVWNHWKSEYSRWSKTQTYPLICQPAMVADQACNQLSGQSRLLEIRPLRETFQLQQINKRPYGIKNLGVFHLCTPKTSFLMRNLLMVTRNLGIYPNKQGHAFQFPIKSREGLPLLPGQWAKKDKFCKWANGSLKNSKHMLVRIWAIGTQEFFKLVALRVFFCF